jgi:nitrate reductase gamma subunit
METFAYFVIYQLPYFAIPFYLIMLGIRIWVWLRFYNPALKLLPGARGSVFQIWQRQYRPTIKLFPGGMRTKGVEWLRLVKGFLFFSGLWKRDKVLWMGSWLLHFGIALYVFAHLRLVLPAGIFSDDGLLLVTKLGCGLMAVSGVYLLIRRVLVQRVREITDFRDYLSKLILLALSLFCSDGCNGRRRVGRRGRCVFFWLVHVYKRGCECGCLVGLAYVGPTIPADDNTFFPFAAFWGHIFEPSIFGHFRLFCRRVWRKQPQIKTNRNRQA